eukprot:1037664-Pelagomonas_calceolata.AAC.3
MVLGDGLVWPFALLQDDKGVFLSFYGNVTSLAPTAELGLPTGAVPSAYFHPGQVSRLCACVGGKDGASWSVVPECTCGKNRETFREPPPGLPCLSTEALTSPMT